MLRHAQSDTPNIKAVDLNNKITYFLAYQPCTCRSFSCALLKNKKINPSLKSLLKGSENNVCCVKNNENKFVKICFMKGQQLVQKKYFPQ